MIQRDPNHIDVLIKVYDMKRVKVANAPSLKERDPGDDEVGLAEGRVRLDKEEAARYQQGVGILFQSGDSLDAILEASHKNLADPVVKAMMAEQNLNPIGRVLGKRLF